MELKKLPTADVKKIVKAYLSEKSISDTQEEVLLAEFTREIERAVQDLNTKPERLDKTKFVDFSYEKWTSGEFVAMQRNGAQVDEIFMFSDPTMVYPVVGLLRAPRVTRLWSAEGRSEKGDESPTDLVLLPRVHLPLTMSMQLWFDVERKEYFALPEGKEALGQCILVGEPQSVKVAPMPLQERTPRKES